jgi:methyltransferase
MCEIVSGALRDTGTAVEWEQLRNEDPNTLRYRGGAGGTQESRTCSIAPTSVSWTRAARRKRAQEPITSRCSPLFHACLRIEELHEGDTPRAGSPLQADRTGKDVALQISLDWVRGRDRAVVESLWAFLVRKIGDAVRLAEQV